MTRDLSSDPVDAGLSALYRAHLADAEQPSAAGDARILALARDAHVQHAANPVATGRASWLKAGGAPLKSGRLSWLKSSWFGPGLAFATIASLSVVIFSLMPNEEMSVEREITAAPSGPVPAASPTGPVTAVATPALSAPPAAAVTAVTPPPAPSGPAAGTATMPTAPLRSPAASSQASAAPPDFSADRAPVGHAAVRMAPSIESAGSLPERGVPGVNVPAPLAGPAPAASSRAPLPAATGAADKALAQRGETTRAPTSGFERPNPFPGQSPSAMAGRLDRAAEAPATVTPPVVANKPGTAPAAVVASAALPAPAAVVASEANLAQRPGKGSLLSDPTESRLPVDQPIAEVRDAVPTYPNEPRPAGAPSGAHPPPRAAARDAASGGIAAKGSLAAQLQRSFATPKEDAAVPRMTGPQPASPAAAAPAASPTMAAAPPLRNPAEWIKAIQKLRSEGKFEQVTKELAEFRRQYPLFPLPDELKQLAK